MSTSSAPERELADFLATWTRRRPGWQFVGTGGNRRLRSAEALARDLLDDAEFAEFRVAEWLRTPEGRIVEAAVSQVLPWPGSAEFQLLVEAISLAAKAKAKAKAKQRQHIRFALRLPLPWTMSVWWRGFPVQLACGES